MSAPGLPSTEVATPDDPARPSENFIGPVVPRVPVRRDRVLAILLCASLAVHLTVLLPSLLRTGETTAPQPHEIPVEIVQLPPEPPKPPPQKAPPPKPQKQAAQKPPPAPPQQQKAAAKPSPKPQKLAQKPPPPAPNLQKAAFKPEPKPAPTPSERLAQLLGMPALALPGATADGSDEVSYAQLVLSKVAKAKKEGRYAGVPGAASVAFLLGDRGDVVKVEIVHASGDPSLDAEAIAMVKRGAPYPAPPPGGRRDYTITLRFQPVI